MVIAPFAAVALARPRDLAGYFRASSEKLCPHLELIRYPSVLRPQRVSTGIKGRRNHQSGGNQVGVPHRRGRGNKLYSGLYSFLEMARSALNSNPAVHK